MGVNRNLETSSKLSTMSQKSSKSVLEQTIEKNIESKSTSNYTETYAERKKNASHLATQYTSTKRITEIVFVSLFVIFLFVSLANIGKHFNLNNIGTISIALVFGALLADMFSGLVHWGADTWGTLNTPFFGKSFIRSFREHHVDPFKITVHDTIETNGDNAMLTFPSLALLSFVNIREGYHTDLFIVCFLFSLTIWVAITNQIHKWAHMRKPPSFINILQKYNILLSRKEHQIHHHNPFDRYYCITNGWLNPVLTSFCFWKRLEVLISSYSSNTPRQDDAFWTIQK